MGVLSPLTLTFEDYTGSIFTVNDVYSATPPFTGPYLYPNGARNQPGIARYQSYTPSGGVTPYWVKLRYVRYSPTAAVTFTSGNLIPVYWKDLTFTVVTPTSSESPLGLNGLAGVLLNTTTTSANLTGNWTMIAVAGYLTGIVSAASTAIGDVLIGNATAQTVTRVAQGTTPTQKVLYMAGTAIASGVSAGMVMCEDVCPPV